MQAVVIAVEFAERVQDGVEVIKAVTEQLTEGEFKEQLMERIGDKTREDIVLQRITIRADDDEEWNRYYQMCIYDHPKDFPNHFVVRKWFIKSGETAPDPVAYCCRTLKEARNQIPPTLHRVARSPGDDPVILETWI